jgi:hypothetical protein
MINFYIFTENLEILDVSLSTFYFDFYRNCDIIFFEEKIKINFPIDIVYDLMMLHTLKSYNKVKAKLSHCWNSSKISHCRNSSKISHCWNSSKNITLLEQF